MNNQNPPEHIPAIHQNLPLRAINQVVFNGDKGFEDATTVLLFQPEKTFSFSFCYHESETADSINKQAEFCIEKCLPEAAPPDYVLLALNPNGEPKNATARANGFRAFYFLFVEEGAFEFRELEPEDFRPRKLEIKILENGLRFYSDASYLIWNEEAAVPPEAEKDFGNPPPTVFP